MSHPQTLAKRLLLPLPSAVQRLGVAVSGGADSVALLRLLHALPADHRPHLVVLHVDHAARPDSRDDARWVEALATGLGHAYRSIRLRPPPKDRIGREGGFEAWARAHRLAAFARFSREEALDAVALGHHAGDQAETLLLRLIRGASLPGLGGMRPLQRLRIDDHPLRLWRPLLGVEQKTLRSFLHSLDQDWREDTTNTDPRFLRNRIRAEVLPMLENLRAGAAGRLAAIAGEFREVQSALAKNAARLFRKYNPQPQSPHIFSPEQSPITKLVLPSSLGRNLPPTRIPLLREFLRQWLCHISPTMAERLDRGLMDRLVDLIRHGSSGRSVEFCGNRITRIKRGLKLDAGSSATRNCSRR